VTTYPVTPIDMSTGKSAIPGRIFAPRPGRLTVRHYHGNTARPDYDRLWVTVPAAGEVTTGGQANTYPGDALVVAVNSGDEVVVSLGTSSSGFIPNSNQARVFNADSDFNGFGRYIEWEDLDLTTHPASDGVYNDSRTLIYYDTAKSWTVGAVGFG